MTLYLDSSSIVKLYVDEPDSADVEHQVAGAEDVASSRIAYAEVRSALARKRREGGLSPADHAMAVSTLRAEWPSFVVVDVTQRVVELAGDFSDAHRLRGMDAIHLASAKLLASESALPVRFSSSDRRLRAAAAAEGVA